MTAVEAKLELAADAVRPSADCGANVVGAEAEILAARVRSVFERLAVTSLITVVNAVLMTLVLQRNGVSQGPWIWLALVVGLALARILSGRLYEQDPGRGHRLRRWALVSVLGSAASGALWGLGAALLFPPDETGQWLWIFLIAGMCAGGASLHAAHLPTALAFVIPASAPLAVRLALEGSASRLAAAAMIVVFMAAIAFTSGRFSRQFGQVLRLQLDLERRTAELDQSNQRLRAEIEQHRATADTLHQAQKMEALGHITGGIAHDFNNLLTVITGSLDLIRKRAAADETVQRLTAAATHASKRGAQLTGSLMRFARKQSLHPAVVDVNALVIEFAPLLRRAAGEAIEVRLDLAGDVAAAYADAAHFQSALLNLVINSRDAMPEGGTIVVATRNVALGGSEGVLDSETHQGRAVVVAIRDQGAGMPPEVLAKAFEPFFTTKQAGHGTGLGLAQVLGFARQSGGYATIDSAPGKGCEVSLVLPALASAISEPANEPGPVDAPEHGPLTVLLAEDNAAVAAMLRESLGLMGWDVVAAPGGREALQLLAKRPQIQVLVADVVMAGGIGGVELARAAVRQRPGLPVVLISGYPGEVVGAEEFELLPKPFTHQELADRIRAALARRGQPEDLGRVSA